MEGRDNPNSDYTDDFNDPNDDFIEPTTENDNLTIDEIIQKNVSKNIRDLRTFLNSGDFVTEKGDQRTNIMNVSEKKTYHIPEQRIEEFFTLLESCRKESRMLHFSERQVTSMSHKSGIMIDFDRYQQVKDVQITEKHFDNLTRNLGKLIRDFVEFEEYAVGGEFVFHIFYIRKPEIVYTPTAAGNHYKDGFHILIPELQMDKGFKKYLLDELINRSIIKNVFKDIDHIESAEKMLDKASATNPVHFFGCSKPEKPAYKLTHVYRVTLFDSEDDVDRKLLELDPILNGTVKLTGDPIPINLAYELSLSFYMPTFGGNPTWLKKRNMNYKKSIEGKIQTIIEKTSKDIFTEDELKRDEEDISLVNISNPQAKYLLSLLKIIDISYANEYEKWFKVLCAIAHTGKSEDYKSVAREFSKRKPDSWSPAEFERVWNEATSDKHTGAPVTIRSIKHWAKEASPQIYAEIEKENYGNILRRAAYDNEGRVEHAHVAKVLAAMCGEKFAADYGQNPETGTYGPCWYEFVIPGQSMCKGEIYKWRYESQPDNVHLYISEHLPKIYAQIRDNIKDRKENAQNEAEMKYWASVERNFRTYTTKLSNDGFQNGIIRQAIFRFRQRGFHKALDSYPDIFGAGNGIIKLGCEPVLIRGFHEYRISKYTETDFISFNPENPRVKTLLSGFHDIFPEEDVFEYMLFHASTGLDAEESACILTLLVGGGQNGKSSFVKMVHNTLGNMYCASGKASLLTAPMEKGESANSAQMQQKDKRYFYIDEFNKFCALNDARVKLMVTPGWQSGRDLHQKQSNFKNTSNPICLSNFDFIIDTTDHGTWRRIYYYKNKVKFCANPNPENPFEKKVNPKFIDEYPNDPEYKQAMLSILVHYNARLHREYKGDLKNVPVPTIMAETEAFRNKCDTINMFITDMLVKSPNAEPIGMSVLTDRYNEWYVKLVKKAPIPVQDVQSQFENSRVSHAIEHRMAGATYLVGYRLKTTRDEELLPGEEPAIIIKPAPVHAFVPRPEPIKIEKNNDNVNDFINNLLRDEKTPLQRDNNNLDDNIADDKDSVNDPVNDLLAGL